VSVKSIAIQLKLIIL